MDPLILLSSVMVTLELGKLASGTKEDVLINSYTLLTSGIFSSRVIEALRSQAGENFCVLYLYCDYDTYKERSATDLIAELLKKAVLGLNETPEEVNREFEKSKKCGDREQPPLQNFVNMLGGVLASFERAFICIDALDEFPPRQRSKFLDSLPRLIHLSPKTRLFLTGRPWIRDEVSQNFYRDEVSRNFYRDAQMIPIKASEEDIQSYIIGRLSKDRYPKEMNSSLEAEIKQILPQNASGMYVGPVVFSFGDVIN